MLSLTRIIAAAIAMLTLLPVAAQASDQDPPPPPPKIQPVKPFEAKWILGPGQSSADTPYYYSYETVDHDDWTYPPPRVP